MSPPRTREAVDANETVTQRRDHKLLWSFDLTMETMGAKNYTVEYK
jgi:hypothetical protein